MNSGRRLASAARLGVAAGRSRRALPWLMGWALLAASATAAAPSGLSLLAPGVHVHHGALEEWGPGNDGDVSNSGVVIGERCVAVIDSGGSAVAARRLVAGVRRLTRLPVCYVITPHAHPDHLLGNSVFEDAARDAGDPAPSFVGHARLRAGLAARGPAYLNALRRDFGTEAASAVRLVAPTVVVEKSLRIDLGGRKLELTAWPTAHTDADLSVLDLQSGTLFLGDLLFIEHTPVVDGRLKGWLGVLAQLRAGPAVRTVVPGHGAASTVWPGALDAQQRYLERLQSDVRRAIKEGVTLPQALERVRPDTPRWRLLDVFHQRNVSAAYAELEWE